MIRNKPYILYGRTVRQEYINAKYLDHKFAHQTGKATVPGKLSEAVRSRDLLLLIQIYAEGAELMEPLPEAGKVRVAVFILFLNSIFTEVHNE